MLSRTAHGAVSRPPTHRTVVREQVPVNPDILRWARKSLGLTVEEVARRMSKTVSVIEAWEYGDAAPTYVQLETLAYVLYRRPVALFFFPEVPVDDPPEKALRALPGEVIEGLPSRIRWLLRKATVLQMNIAELRGPETRPPRNIVRDLDFSAPPPDEAMAQQVRVYLGRTLPEQQSWNGADAAFKHWRVALEDAGVSVFKDSFRTPGRSRENRDTAATYSGFCLYDDDYPLICVNNNDAKPRQVFTLFHELAHLLMRTGSVDMRTSSFSDALSGSIPTVEARCNRFAAEFLVPAADLSDRLRGPLPDDDAAVSDWAQLYGVSRETILRRLLDAGRISEHEYQQRAERSYGQVAGSSEGGNYFLTHGAYLGERYVETVFKQYYRDRISLRDVADYLRVKIRHVDRMEEWLFAQKEESRDDLRI